MTPQQHDHLQSLIDQTRLLLNAKYRQGTVEHDGNLWDNKDLLGEAINEAIDLITYLLTLKMQRQELNLHPPLLTEPILVKQKNPEHVGILPPALPGDVGFDLVCSEDTVIPPNTNVKNAIIVPAGVQIKIPDGHFCQITGRSSAAKRGLSIQTATIDNGYTGELFSCCWNQTQEPIIVKKGERIAQVVFFPICLPPLKIIDELPTTERGSNGFGSTNK